MTSTKDWMGRTGQVWAQEVHALDPMLSAAGQIGIARLGALRGKRVLDLGCGAGQSVQALCAAGAQVTGIDVSPDLIACARQRVPDADFLLGDAGKSELNGPYDAIFSRFGAMFFDDPVAAFGHLRAQAGPNCRLSIVCWGDRRQNGWATIPVKAALNILPTDAIAPAPDGTPGPFGWERRDLFEPILRHAGWQDLRAEEVAVDVPVGLGDDPDPVERGVQFMCRIGPLARHIAKADDAVKQAIRKRLKPILAEYATETGLVLPGQIWVIEGQS